jgi:hypothetical protein
MKTVIPLTVFLVGCGDLNVNGDVGVEAETVIESPEESETSETETPAPSNVDSPPSDPVVESPMVESATPAHIESEPQIDTSSQETETIQFPIQLRLHTVYRDSVSQETMGVCLAQVTPKNPDLRDPLANGVTWEFQIEPGCTTLESEIEALSGEFVRNGIGSLNFLIDQYLDATNVNGSLMIDDPEAGSRFHFFFSDDGVSRIFVMEFI